MKIGIVCYPTYGGSGIIATELASIFGRDHDVHLLSYERPVRAGKCTTFSFHKVDILSYPLFEYPPYTLALASELADTIREHELDIVHVHYAIPNSISAYLAKKMTGDRVKIVTTLHGTDSYLVGQHPSYKNATQFSLERTDGLTAVSRYLREKTLEDFNISTEIEVIPNFVDPDKFRNLDGSSDEKIICHSSNFRPVKRIPDIIRAFGLIREEVDCKLHLIGNGPEKEKAEKMVNDLGISDSVRFFGKVKEVQEILGKADIFFLPSERESFGLAALEALSCGVPVIASDVGGLRELISHGEDGFLVERGDFEAIADYAVKILRDTSLKEKLSESARNKAKEYYSPEIISEKYLKLYRRMLAEG